MSFDWKGILSNVAPALGTAIGGPFGALAGTVIKAALGLSEDTTEDKMKEAIKNATPDQLLAIQQAEQKFKYDMEKLGVDVMKIDADDRASARNREVAMSGWGKYATPVLAFMAVSGFMSATGFVLIKGMSGIDPGVAAFVGALIGQLSSKAEAVYNYYFGSSASGRSKDGMLYQSTPANK